jgi:hypothetical protein
MNRNERRVAEPEIPDWKLERFLLGELPEETMEEIRRIADEDTIVQARLDELKRSNQQILDEYPVERMASRIQARLLRDNAGRSTAGRRRTLRFALVPAGLVAALALAVFVLPNLPRTGNVTAPDVTRIKGPSAHFRLHRKTATGSELLEDECRAAEKDLVLLQYQTDQPAYGAILSVDGRGTITRHLPESGTQAVELELGGSHFLAHAYELDDAPGWEVFYFVTFPSPFTIDTVTRAVEGALGPSGFDGDSGTRKDLPSSLDLPEGFHVSKFTLVKDSGLEH